MIPKLIFLKKEEKRHPSHANILINFYVNKNEKIFRNNFIGTGFYVCGKNKKTMEQYFPQYSHSQVKSINVKITIALNKENSKNHF